MKGNMRKALAFALLAFAANIFGLYLAVVGMIFEDDDASFWLLAAGTIGCLGVGYNLRKVAERYLEGR